MEIAKARFTLDRAEYLKAVRFMLARGRGRLWETVAAVVVVVATGTVLLLEHATIVGSALVIIGMGVVLLPLIAYWQQIRRWDATTGDNVERAYQISEDGIELTTLRTTVVRAWTMYDVLFVTPDMLILRAMKPAVFIIFPKRGFETTIDEWTFLAIAKRHIKVLESP